MCRRKKQNSGRASPASRAVSATRWPRQGVAGRAEDGDEDLGLTDFTGLSVDDGRGLSGVIDEQLFAGTVLLAHDNVDLGGPEAVVLAEPAVLEALRVSESIFLPE